MRWRFQKPPQQRWYKHCYKVRNAKNAFSCPAIETPKKEFELHKLSTQEVPFWHHNLTESYIAVQRRASTHRMTSRARSEKLRPPIYNSTAIHFNLCSSSHPSTCGSFPVEPPSPGSPGSVLLGPSTTDHYLDNLHYVLKGLNCCPRNLKRRLLLALAPVWNHICILLWQTCDQKAGGRTCQLLSVNTFELGSQAMFFACAVWHDWAGRRYARAKKKNRSTSGFPYPSPLSLFPALLAPSPSRSISHLSRLLFSLWDR